MWSNKQWLFKNGYGNPPYFQPLTVIFLSKRSFFRQPRQGVSKVTTKNGSDQKDVSKVTAKIGSDQKDVSKVTTKNGSDQKDVSKVIAKTAVTKKMSRRSSPNRQ